MFSHRVLLKYFFKNNPKVDPAKVVALFHQWIQTQALPGQLIDVTDYSHVDRGPGVLLVGHDAHYSIDDRLGQCGLTYEQKHLAAPISEALPQVFRTALDVCKKLLSHADFSQYAFDANEFVLGFPDRLNAPNNAKGREALEPHLDRLIEKLYSGSSAEKIYDHAPRAFLSVRVKIQGDATIETLSSRL